MTKVFLSPFRNKRITNGHPWIYDNEVKKIEGNFENGDIVEVYDAHKKFIGKGYINSNSHILVRILTYQRQEEINQLFFDKKLKYALDYRLQMGFTQNFRLVFGEADFLSGLVIDKFGDYLVLQILSLGMEKFKPLILESLEKLLKPKGIYERNDVPVREMEGLTQQTGFLKPFEIPKNGVEIVENGFKFSVDIVNGQKTGYFLDQTRNRATLANFVKGKKVLDCFCHTGSFAIHAAGYGASHVTALDISEQAISSAKINAKLNNFEEKIDFVCDNAFDWLKESVTENKLFDVVILDPPAFTKSRANIESAVRGYKEINLRGMKLVKKGGFLITCTCSHFVSNDLFRKTIQEAAVDAHRTVREVIFQPQNFDHPILWSVEESFYLKFYVLQVL
ncbi:MAG: class I SAM-dependent rRNA methyltransferase [Bacteroidetes bacterium]|nr:MAG: class I SAM-dependent rRNA methyltransferase [Bacteroidota bacterium]